MNTTAIICISLCIVHMIYVSVSAHIVVSRTMKMMDKRRDQQLTDLCNSFEREKELRAELYSFIEEQHQFLNSYPVNMQRAPSAPRRMDMQNGRDNGSLVLQKEDE